MLYRVVLSVLALLAVQLAAAAGAARATGATEHPVIKPFGGAKMVDAPSKTTSFDTFDFLSTDANGKSSKVSKSGKHWYLKYRITDSAGKLNKNVGAAEIIENYKSAAKAKGGRIAYDYSNYLTFVLTREDGGETWAQVNASDGTYDLYIIDEKGLDPTLVFGAEEMQSELNLDGVAVIYGIHFAVDSDRLELGAEEVLIEMVKLMQGNPGLKIEVQGHTDSTGSSAHNLDLSTRRAATVVNFLLMYGIDKGRMTSKGLGEEKPIADNNTEQGMALNRRVELHQR